MAGLVASAMQQGAPAAPPQAPGAPQPTGAAPPIPQGVEQPGSKLKNPILNQVEAGVEAKISPQYQAMYKSIIVSAMDLCFNQKTHPLMIKGLQSSPDMIKNISLVVAGMMGIIYEHAKQDPNKFLPAAMPASIVTMCQIMEFAEQAGMLQVDDDKVAQCTNATSQAVLRKFGVDGSKLKQAMDSKGGAQQPPAPQPGQAPAMPQPGAPQPQMQGA